MISDMTLGAILMGIALAIIVALYLLRPFVFPENEDVRHDREEIDALLLRKDNLLRQIRELDDDMESAKVAPEMYQRTRPQLVKQAAIIMQQLDAHGYVETPLATAASTAGTDDQIEAAVKKLRTPQEVDAAIETAVRQTRAAQPVPANGAGSYCSQCGRRIEPDDRFCPGCGHKLSQEPTIAQAGPA